MAWRYENSRGVPLLLETLEFRVLLSASLENGVATIIGTDGNDDILVAIAAAGTRGGAALCPGVAAKS